MCVCNNVCNYSKTFPVGAVLLPCTCSRAKEHALSMESPAERPGGGDYRGYVCINTEIVVVRRGANISRRFTDSGYKADWEAGK